MQNSSRMPYLRARNADARPGIAYPYGDRANRRRFAAADDLLCTVRRKVRGLDDVEVTSVVEWRYRRTFREKDWFVAKLARSVGNWAPGVYEVEFCDDNGRAYARVALKTETTRPMSLWGRPSVSLSLTADKTAWTATA